MPARRRELANGLSAESVGAVWLEQPAVGSLWTPSAVWLPLPQMDSDPVRHALDDAVTQAIGVDANLAAEIRRALSEEPCVTQKRYNR